MFMEIIICTVHLTLFHQVFSSLRQTPTQCVADKIVLLNCENITMAQNHAKFSYLKNKRRGALSQGAQWW